MDVEGSFNTRWGKLSAVLLNNSNRFRKQKFFFENQKS